MSRVHSLSASSHSDEWLGETILSAGSEAVQFDADAGRLGVPLRRPTTKRAASEFVPVGKGHDLDIEWVTGEPLCG